MIVHQIDTDDAAARRARAAKLFIIALLAILVLAPFLIANMISSALTPDPLVSARKAQELNEFMAKRREQELIREQNKIIYDQMLRNSVTR